LVALHGAGAAAAARVHVSGVVGLSGCSFLLMLSSTNEIRSLDSSSKVCNRLVLSYRRSSQ
jgi:hypothetical protein